MPSQKIFIATPVNEPHLNIGYVQSLLTTDRMLRAQGIGIEIVFETQCSLVMAGRNALVADFMESDATDLFFIDSDIGWQAEDLVKMVRHPVDFVAAVYRKKTPETVFTLDLDNPTSIERDPATGLLKARGVGAGFLRLRRDCIEKMIAAYPQLKIEVRGKPQHALFDTSIEDGKHVGEDYTFCRRWRAIGGTVWMDPTVPLSHFGSTAFSGSLMEALAVR